MWRGLKGQTGCFSKSIYIYVIGAFAGQRWLGRSEHRDPLLPSEAMLLRCKHGLEVVNAEWIAACSLLRRFRGQKRGFHGWSCQFHVIAEACTLSFGLLRQYFLFGSEFYTQLINNCDM